MSDATHMVVSHSYTINSVFDEVIPQTHEGRKCQSVMKMSYAGKVAFGISCNKFGLLRYENQPKEF